ncbi:M50 family metallopeptidase [Bacillus xiapuensis]|uniref:M50 family metallopeptidase n=1 Tax=Bacillus xiapuensis TaxID=2014075 RepID=UPI000C2429C3|nr:M50 family metallopeptidase [Bacillus xiapuensis]
MNKLLRKVHLHPLLWLMIAVSAWTGHFRELLLIFFIIAVHEFGHAWMAHVFRWRIKQIIFLPFGGVAEVDEHGNRPIKEELLVILAGPVQHLWMFAAAWLLHEFSLLPDMVYHTFMQFNAAILLFNLLPVYPLDGGKLLLLFFSMTRPFLAAVHLTILSSAALLVLLQAGVLLFFSFHLQAWLVLLYLAAALWREWKEKHYTFIRFLLERHYGNQPAASALQPLPADGELEIGKVLERFRRNTKHIVYVSIKGGERVRLDENELLHAYFSEKRTTARLIELLPIH